MEISEHFLLIGYIIFLSLMLAFRKRLYKGLVWQFKTFYNYEINITTARTIVIIVLISMISIVILYTIVDILGLLPIGN